MSLGIVGGHDDYLVEKLGGGSPNQNEIIQYPSTSPKDIPNYLITISPLYVNKMIGNVANQMR